MRSYEEVLGDIVVLKREPHLICTAQLGGQIVKQ